MLDEDGRFSFQQEIESILGSVDFQESVDDENNEKDPGEDPEIDRRETSFYLILVVSQNNPVQISFALLRRRKGFSGMHGSGSMHPMSHSGEFLFRAPFL